MNKSDLKTKWGKYADTDKLVDDICGLLTTYRHRNTEHGVCVMLDKYFTNKEPLIQLLAKSENYAGNMRIVMTKEFDRDNAQADVRKFCDNFIKKLNIDKAILSKTNAEGKTIADCLKIGVTGFDVSRLHSNSPQKIKISELEFNADGYTKESSKKFTEFYNLNSKFRYIYKHTLSHDDVVNLAKSNEQVKFAEGMKTSRAFNRMCDTYGVSKIEGYNKLFAEYSDMVSDLKRTLDYVISVNPYDYLTMSFGVNWASCHTIDKTNRRGMPNSYSGQYCGGTLSYMLDGSSIITYVVNKGGDTQNDGKIYRNMFHLKNKTLIQGRIYPQGNDGATDLYSKFRKIMHEELSKMLDLSSDDWEVKKGTSECGRYSFTQGVHYVDYLNFGSCNVSYPTGIRPEAITIGHEGICPCCGAVRSTSTSLSHDTCAPRRGVRI
jgi:hypothetical protein